MGQTALLALLFVFSAPSRATSVVTCYTNVQILGDLEQLDGALKRVTSIYTLHTRIYSLENSGQVAVEFLVSATGVDSNRVMSQVAPIAVQKVFSAAGLPPDSITSQLLGCNSVELK